MDDTRLMYQTNHRHLRHLASNKDAEQRAKDLAAVCKERAFWLGDRWSQPAHPGSQAALRVLRDRPRIDPLQRMAQIRALIPASELPAFLRIRHGLRTLWTR